MRREIGPRLVSWPATIAVVLFILFGVVLLGGCSGGDEAAFKSLMDKCEEDTTDMTIRIGTWNREVELSCHIKPKEEK